jgi:peptide chain release factor 2
VIKRELGEIEAEMSKDGFWNDQEAAQEVGRKRRLIERNLETAEALYTGWEEIEVMRELDKEGEDVAADLDALVTRIDKTLSEVELRLKLSGEHDSRDAIVSIHPGAGGTESQDWAEMLLRMVIRYCEDRGFDLETIEYQNGDEAGIKGATIMVRGDHAYGYLKSEHGVHRLVRISPFDAQKRRHTSFASVHVYPDIDEEIEIEINDKDLRVDTYRSSGAGGQHVNVTDSAVRITHLSSGIVVTCQNERSQGKNRATAMKILKARLYQLELEKRKEETSKIGGEKKDIDFGSQIRSYVLQPYQLVKDLRTGHEVGNPAAVLDGDLYGFVEAYLVQQAQQGS